jgi:hypothetical protein
VLGGESGAIRRRRFGALHSGKREIPNLATITGEGVHRLVGDTLNLFSYAPGVLAGEVVDEKRNVIAAVS